jgi:type I restriction enzyme M protein
VQGKKQNSLSEENISKIVNAYKKRKNVDKYAHVASFDEIEGNEFNLNIPRYVDTFEEEAPINVDAVQKDIDRLEKELAELRKQMAQKLKEIKRG